MFSGFKKKHNIATDLSQSYFFARWYEFAKKKLYTAIIAKLWWFE